MISTYNIWQSFTTLNDLILNRKYAVCSIRELFHRQHWVIRRCDYIIISRRKYGSYKAVCRGYMNVNGVMGFIVGFIVGLWFDSGVFRRCDYIIISRRKYGSYKAVCRGYMNVNGVMGLIVGLWFNSSVFRRCDHVITSQGKYSFFKSMCRITWILVGLWD